MRHRPRADPLGRAPPLVTPPLIGRAGSIVRSAAERPCECVCLGSNLKFLENLNEPCESLAKAEPKVMVAPKHARWRGGVWWCGGSCQCEVLWPAREAERRALGVTPLRSAARARAASKREQPTAIGSRWWSTLVFSLSVLGRADDEPSE